MRQINGKVTKLNYIRAYGNRHAREVQGQKAKMRSAWLSELRVPFGLQRSERSLQEDKKNMYLAISSFPCPTNSSKGHLWYTLVDTAPNLNASG